MVVALRHWLLAGWILIQRHEFLFLSEMSLIALELSHHASSTYGWGNKRWAYWGWRKKMEARSFKWWCLEKMEAAHRSTKFWSNSLMQLAHGFSEQAELAQGRWYRYYSAGIKQKTSSRGHVDICICPGHYFLTFHLIPCLIDWLDGAVQVGLLGCNHYEANSVLKAIVDPNSPSGEQGSWWLISIKIYVNWFEFQIMW